MTEAQTTVRLKKSTVKRIQRLGDLSDSWDTLLNAMADYIEEHEDDWWEEDEEDEETEPEEPGNEEGVAS